LENRPAQVPHARENGPVRSLANRSEPIQGQTEDGRRSSHAFASLRGRSVPRVVISLVIQIGAIYLILQAYSFVRRSIWQRSPEVAFDHALDVVDLQRWLGLSVDRVELPLQRFALEHGWLIDVFNAYYRNMKLAVFLAAGLAVIFAPAGYRRVRRLFLWATLVAFPWFALYPLAPPRFMEPYGYDFVDTLAVIGGTVSKSGGLAGANQYAAMPSMHIGWSVVAAAWIAVALPWKRVGTVLGVVHVVIMSAAVMATGNHFWLDIAGGFVVVVAAIGLDRAAQRWLRVDRRVPVWMSFGRGTGWG
jgi:hypothetical protein